eukprot:7336408-Alexandrium_andersonii.AAC.2
MPVCTIPASAEHSRNRLHGHTRTPGVPSKAGICWVPDTLKWRGRNLPVECPSFSEASRSPLHARRAAPPRTPCTPVSPHAAAVDEAREAAHARPVLAERGGADQRHRPRVDPELARGCAGGEPPAPAQAVPRQTPGRSSARCRSQRRGLSARRPSNSKRN